MNDASDEARRGLDTILRNAQAQAKLIDDLLDMSRIVSGKIRLDVQPVDLAPVVLSAIEAVRPSADAKGIRLRTTLDPSSGPVLADPNRIQQVIWNLLTNAVKFTPKGGTIDVVLQRVNSHFEIMVQDSGCGIPPDFLPHIFERFRQADASISRRFGGLGLGMAIAKQLVELHGGTIVAASAGQGRGATFVVGLPLRAMHEPSPRGEDPRASIGTDPLRDGVSLASLHVLVVDDQEDARELLRSVLVGANATVVLAESADEALRLVTSQRPDVIVSDIGLPGRDGYDLIRDVRQLPGEAGGLTPAIAVTAFARSEDRTRAMLAGYQMHLAKPVEPRELLAAIRSVAIAMARK